MNQPIVKAVNLISHNVDNERETTGRYTKFGDPVFRNVSKKIQPKTLFDIRIFPEDEQRRLWELGAIEEVSEIELAVWEKLNPEEKAKKEFGQVVTGYGSEPARGDL